MDLKLTESEVSQTINLRELLGGLADNQAITESFKAALVDHIRDRTRSGRDADGKLFTPYSKSYKNSLAFKVYGKSDVDMTLTGDMLDTMKVEEKGFDIKITFDGLLNNTKAFAHMTGFEGHPTIKDTKPRKFFGITDKELEKIAMNFKPDLSTESKKNDQTLIGKLLRLFG
jgi:hypothetical protein